MHACIHVTITSGSGCGLYLHRQSKARRGKGGIKHLCIASEIEMKKGCSLTFCV